MLFNSWQFLIFFPLVSLFFFTAPRRHRWVILLAASCWFYMSWKPVYIVLLFLSASLDYVAALGIHRARSESVRKTWLGVTIAGNLGLLLAFKYYAFLMGAARSAAAGIGMPFDPPILDVLLPVGISFYTFQTMSYTFDVYRGHLAPERHFGKYSVYVTYFPQLVAGPIERATNLLPQFDRPFSFCRDRATTGLRLALWGFFKKMVVADNLAVVVDRVYADPGAYPGAASIVATVFFAFQIYCDFSGYTDIAIGLARLMGIDLMLNFRQPYFGRNIRDFWRRWHISLTTWFRDYVYFPLGGGRVGRVRRLVNVMIVFLVSGIWHGANWTFVAWGSLHGGYYLASLAGERIFGPEEASPAGWRSVLRRGTATALTFIAVCLAWVFFRAASVSQAILILGRLGEDAGRWMDAAFWMALPARLGLDPADTLTVAFSLVTLFLVDAVNERVDAWRAIDRFSRPLRWLVYLVLALSILNLGVVRTVPFIYFQF